MKKPPPAHGEYNAGQDDVVRGARRPAAGSPENPSPKPSGLWRAEHDGGSRHARRADARGKLGPGHRPPAPAAARLRVDASFFRFFTSFVSVRKSNAKIRMSNC